MKHNCYSAVMLVVILSISAPAAQKVDQDLTGKQTMTHVVNSVEKHKDERADWADASISYSGRKPMADTQAISFPPLKELPGGPANAPSDISTGRNGKSLVLNYNGSPILEAKFDRQVKVRSTVTGEKAIEQRITLNVEEAFEFHAVIHGSCEGMAAETRGSAQKKFPLVRTSHGLSNNLRNNAIYDRNLDWMLEAPETATIKSFRNTDGSTRFELNFAAEDAELIFRPRYYQKHKNLPYFQPWTYSIRKDSITGWCSWWAHFEECRQEHIVALLEVFNEKNFADYGYWFIGLDDAFQGGSDGDRRVPEGFDSPYIGGRPETWLEWKRDFFPWDMSGYVKAVNQAGFDPAVWMGCYFTDEEIVEEHPDWFIQGANGKPYVGDWITYVFDATNPEVADTLIRPTFRGLKNAGFRYVKIDQLRHMLYDNLNKNHDYLVKIGKSPDEVFRAYMRIAREELGEDCLILSCWGVLPESIGLADTCRIGGDGYGPSTMQEYNSWNGIVWINDPDHCDVLPEKEGVDDGNVRERRDVGAEVNDTIIRPALASIAGCPLILSDKAEIYKDDRNLVGARRSSPVLFSMPGQLYDFDPEKTDTIKVTDRGAFDDGNEPVSIDADREGEVCPFWMNEFNKPFESWYVLHRLNWTEDSDEIAEPCTIRFADLGLDPGKEYLVYEFWADQLLGVLKNQIKLGNLAPMGLQSLAIREKLNRPQFVSSNRHLSQGAAEIEKMRWKDNTLTGRSRVIVDDRYVLTLYIPEGYKLVSAKVNGREAKTDKKRNVLKVSYLPDETASVAWEVVFSK